MATDEVKRNRDVEGADIQGDSEGDETPASAVHNTDDQRPSEDDAESTGNDDLSRPDESDDAAIQTAEATTDSEDDDESSSPFDDVATVVLGGDEVITDLDAKHVDNPTGPEDGSSEPAGVDEASGENGGLNGTDVLGDDLGPITTQPMPPPLQYFPDEGAEGMETPMADEQATTAEADVTGIHEPPIDDVLEMRQVAGLTAGSMMRLGRGRAFEFNESNEGLSFSLRVLEDGQVVVHPGTAQAVVDEVEISEPMVIGDGILNVSSACFSVRPPRRPASSESRMAAIGATFAPTSAIPVPPLGVEQPLPADQTAGSRLGTLLDRNPLTRGSIGPNAWDFLQSIREMRAVVAERHRLMHPDPEELKTRLSRLDPGLWERGRDHPQFGRFSVGYATIPWEPRFDNPELIPESLHEPIVEMSLLPWVPVTANLLYGPLGIVGRRAARLAAARHAVLSLAALSIPGEIRFAIRSGDATAPSWHWARAFPPMMSSGEGGFVVTLVDGVEQSGPADLANSVAELEGDATVRLGGATGPAGDVGSEADDDDETSEVPSLSASETGAGLILLAETANELAEPCGTVLEVASDGTGRVTNHLGETIQVTPIGVTEAFAHDMATRITDILTESFL